MSWFTQSFTYSIGKKIIMALTGLFLVLFLIEHVAGNFLLFANDGGTLYNDYSHAATHNIFIRIVEIFLFAALIFHVLDAYILWGQNKAARPQGYAMTRRNENSFWNSRNMIVTGSLILLFLIIHLGTFFYPYRFTNNVPNLYMRVHDEFQSPWFAGFYVFSMIMLALHMQHGFKSGFQTLGMRHPKYYPTVKALSWILTIIICGGFAAQPIYFLFYDKFFS